MHTVPHRCRRYGRRRRCRAAAEGKLHDAVPLIMAAAAVPNGDVGGSLPGRSWRGSVCRGRREGETATATASRGRLGRDRGGQLLPEAGQRPLGLSRHSAAAAAVTQTWTTRTHRAPAVAAGTRAVAVASRRDTAVSQEAPHIRNTAAIPYTRRPPIYASWLSNKAKVQKTAASLDAAAHLVDIIARYCTQRPTSTSKPFHNLLPIPNPNARVADLVFHQSCYDDACQEIKSASC